MLNEYLTKEELQSELKEFVDSHKVIFTQIDPKRGTLIFQDKKRLARLHHSVNISKYSQKAFRQKLFAGAPDKQILRFAKSLNMPYSTFEETQTEKFRDNLASFAWGNNDQTRDFVRIFGYPEYLVPNSKGIVSEEIIEPHDKPFKQLEDYQATMVFKALDHLKNPNTKFLIHMPTGAGKTRVAMEIIARFLNEKEDRQVIWLADRVDLCEQAMNTFLNVWKHMGNRRLQTYRIWADAEIPRQIDNFGFIVAMYQNIRNPIKNDQLVIKADLIVPDEAHIAIAETYAEIIDSLSDIFKKQTRVMGLTAIPGKGSSDISENAELVNFFNNNIIGIKTVGSMIEYLQRKRILSKCVRETLNTNIKYQLSKQEWDTLTQSFEHEYPDGLLERIADDEMRNATIILRLKELAKKCKHIMVFCGSIKQSKLLSGFMVASGYTSAYVDDESPENYRKDVINKFQDDQLQFIFNYNFFATRFDVPKIDAVVIARPTTSMVLYDQMIGLGMRGLTMGGTDKFQLVDVIDDIITEYGGLDDVHEYFSRYWEVEPTDDQRGRAKNLSEIRLQESSSITSKSNTDAIIPKNEDTWNEFKSTFQYDLREEELRRDSKPDEADIRKNNYKQIREDIQKEVALTIAAFANKDGGRLFVGVKDDSSVLGLGRDLRQYGNNIDRFTLAITDSLKKFFRNNAFISNLDFKFAEKDGKQYLVIDIPKATKPIFVHIINGQEAYVRMQKSSEKFLMEDFMNYCETRFPNR